MPYPVQNKADAIAQLTALTQAFAAQEAHFKSAGYKESQLRNDFLNPLLKAFGWDVDNEAGKSQKLRDVLQEEELAVEEDDATKIKNPDYTLQIFGVRKLFVEAKKAYIHIETAPGPAFQTRRYGWSGQLALSVLTNFDWLVFYDCRYKPVAGEAATVALFRSYHYSEFIEKYDELAELLGYAAVESGAADNALNGETPTGQTFDDFFLAQIKSWRLSLAQNIISTNPELDEQEVNFQVQRLLNRIVFLRICEDRGLEGFEQLHRVTSYAELKQLFQAADKKYNSGLFDFIEDATALRLTLHAEPLLRIFNELYYPQSPYNFAVVDPEILSQIYERFLGSRIIIDEHGQAQMMEMPEVAASAGVVPTPKLVVRKVVRDTMELVCAGRTFDQLSALKVADISCGSGTFLLGVYDYLLEKLVEQVGPEHIRQGLARVGLGGAMQLTLRGKQALLTQCVYGVDINPYAVEVARFSLSLKLLEGETKPTIEEHLAQPKARVLPSLNASILNGNSLLDSRYLSFNQDAADDIDLLLRLRPFDWNQELPFLTRTGGFDAIVGNPPYVRIQNMELYAPEEKAYYQEATSGYVAAGAGNAFDKYYLFIQRALELLNGHGYLGYIVPHKFFTLGGAKVLRHYLASHSSLAKVVHFGSLQLFPERSTYTAIVVLSKQPLSTFDFTRVRDQVQGLLTEQPGSQYQNSDLGAAPWLFVAPETKAIFERVRTVGTVPLGGVADILVGLQTSADGVYILRNAVEVGNYLHFKTGKGREEQQWVVERSICRPSLMKVSFEAFDTVAANAWMLYPYKNVGGAAVLLDEDTLRTDYPRAWDYLNAHRDQLSRRSINGVSDLLTGEPVWYQFGRNQNLTKFINAPKLLFPVLSRRPKYVFDNTNMQFTGGGNGPYYSIVGKGHYSLLYLMAIISHPIFEAMVKARASEFEGAYYSHGKQFITGLPIRQIDFNVAADQRKHDTIVQAVEQLIEAKAQARANRLPANQPMLQRVVGTRQQRVRSLVDALYELTAADAQTVAEDDILYGQVEE
jgi:type I restriction-modification system DNA methylase subunit